MPHQKALRLIDQQAQPGEKPLYIVWHFQTNDRVLCRSRVVAKPGVHGRSDLRGHDDDVLLPDITGVQAQAKLRTGYLEILTSSYQANNSKSYWSQGKDNSPDKLPNCIPMMSADQRDRPPSSSAYVSW